MPEVARKADELAVVMKQLEVAVDGGDLPVVSMPSMSGWAL